MDKIKIKDLDVKKVVVPKGYKVIIDPELIEKERKEQELTELEARMKDQVEPSDEELIEYAKMTHPYYMDLDLLNSLK
jgi:hypothetical protein